MHHPKSRILNQNNIFINIITSELRLFVGSSIGCMHLRGSLWQFGWGSKVNPFVTKGSILMFQECYKTEYDFSQYPENDFVTKLHHGRDNELLIETIVKKGELWCLGFCTSVSCY